MAYFKYFNLVGYDIRGKKNNQQFDIVTNILQRARLKPDFIKNNTFFAKYFVMDGETPEKLAFQFYGDTELHWVIMFANKVTNPYYDWPQTYLDLQKYITKKYGAGNENNIHHYEDVDGYEVDSDAAGATSITNSVYEEKRNDNLRTIDVIRAENVNSVVNELKTLLK